MKISTVEEMRNLDRSAIENYDISQELLMENAGLATFFVILEQIGIEGKSFVILCGPGNNGGDGLVVARKIYSAGGTVLVFLMSDQGKFKGAAKNNFEIVSKLPIEVKKADDIDALAISIAQCDVIVDGILGTGISGEVMGKYRDTIEIINDSNKTVVSLDIPSGTNGNNGKIMGVAVKSDYTVTYGLPKIGNILYPGYENCGKLYVTHISFPPELHNESDIKTETGKPSPLPPRPRDGHKGNFGKVLFIAGSRSYYGAPYYSALSFLKAGGGYSRLAAPHSIIPYIASEGKEIVFIPLDETKNGTISIKNKDQLVEIASHMDIVVIGPGISLDSETQKLVRILAGEIECPLIIDGDGITAISKDKEILSERDSPSILTPHLGEMSRIVSMDTEKIRDNSIEILRREAKVLDSIIVLKGAHSMVALPDQTVSVNMSGNPGMATAGSGDVLTGCVTAMFGLGLPLSEAITTGVFIHGLSGDLAAKEKGEDGITAQDIMDFLPLALKEYRENYTCLLNNCYSSIYSV